MATSRKSIKLFVIRPLLNKEKALGLSNMVCTPMYFRTVQRKMIEAQQTAWLDTEVIHSVSKKEGDKAQSCKSTRRAVILRFLSKAMGIVGDHESKKRKRDEGEATGEMCAICLDTVDNSAIPDCCEHKYCLLCIEVCVFFFFLSDITQKKTNHIADLVQNFNHLSTLFKKNS